MTMIKRGGEVNFDVNVSTLDKKYTGKHTVVFQTQVFDGYNEQWLDPRKLQVMLTPDEMRQLGRYLIAYAG